MCVCAPGCMYSVLVGTYANVCVCVCTLRLLAARTLGLILKASNHMLIGLEKAGRKKHPLGGKKIKNNSENRVIAPPFVH